VTHIVQTGEKGLDKCSRSFTPWSSNVPKEKLGDDVPKENSPHEKRNFSKPIRRRLGSSKFFEEDTREKGKEGNGRSPKNTRGKIYTGGETGQQGPEKNKREKYPDSCAK